MLLSYSVTRSLQQPLIEMHHLREKTVISGPKQLAENSQKTIISGNQKGSIKQTNTSQVLVSETVPDRRVQLSREAKKTRFQDNPVSSTVAIPPRR